MKKRNPRWIAAVPALLWISLAPRTDAAPVPAFDLTLKDAERRMLSTSNELQAYSAARLGTVEQADAQYSALLPRLTLDARYSYVTNVPTINLPIPGFNQGVVFGTHNNYSIGPTLSYTLWDTGSARDSYQGLSLLAEARDEDERSARIQLLLSVRAAYLRVQLALQEQSLLNDSLNLSRAQNHDIEANFKAGAATRLDRVDSQRDVLNYQLQYEQKQNEVAADLQDLLALVQETLPASAARPGLDGLPGTQLELHLDSLEQSLRDTDAWTFSAPDESHPQIKSAELLAQSSERAASSTSAALYPTVQLSANASYEYPNVVVPEHTEQNTFAVSVSMPLFEGSRTRHLAAEKIKEAENARFTKEQNSDQSEPRLPESARSRHEPARAAKNRGR